MSNHTRTEIVTMLDADRRKVVVTLVWQDHPASPSLLISAATREGHEVTRESDGRFVASNGAVLVAVNDRDAESNKRGT